MKIFISCGHNNAYNWIRGEHGKIRLSLFRDQGAVSGTDTEYRFTRKIADEIQKKYSQKQSIEYVFVPEKLNLQDRISWINKRASENDVCIELHLDSATPQAQGCTTYYYAGNRYAQDKAQVFQMEYTRVTGIKGRGVKGDSTNRWGRLAFVRDTNPLAFLLEMGFITNQFDKDRVWTKGAEALVSAIQKTFSKT